MKWKIALTVAVLLGTLPVATNGVADDDVNQAVLKAEADRIAAMDKAKVAVLAIFSSSGRGGGSGVVISPDGYALTNFHVAKPCGNAMKCGMADGRLYDAVIVGIDPTGDVALIKLFGRDDFPHAEMADSDRARAGDWVFAMGNPFLLATDFQPTVTYGILSGVHRYQYPAGTILEYADCLQTDASINPGNSGGPLFDARGRLLGINGRGSFEKRGRVCVGVGYAISINQIKNFLGYLRSGRIVDHATLGAQVGTDEDGCVVVTNILDSSDAYRRGLRYDDEILSFAGRPIHTTNGFKNALGIFPKGWRVPLTFRREGENFDIMVRLAGVHGEAELLEKVKGRRRHPVPMPIPKPKENEPKPGEKPKPGDKPKPDHEHQPKDLEPAKKIERIEIKPGQIKPAEKPKNAKPADKPKPKDEKSKPEDEKSKPKAQQHRRIQIPAPRDGQPQPRMLRRPAPMPEIVKKHFEKKRGYANYYFNKLHRDRVWKAWTARGDYTSLGGTWTISGQVGTGGKFRLELTDAEIRLKLPTTDYKWTAGDELGTSLAPPQSGGLLLALHLWRRLAVEGPGNFGEVSYIGTMPLAGREGLVDALYGTHGGVECRLLFDPDEGDLLLLEMYPEDGVDPCELCFSEYREIDGRMVPGRIEARFGDAPYGVFKPETFTFEKTPKKSPDAKKPAEAKKPTDDKKSETGPKPAEKKQADEKKKASK